MKKKIIMLFVIVGLFVLACGCVEETIDESEQPPATETGSVTFLVKDKVTEDFDHVNVTFSELRLFYQNDTEEYESIMSDPVTVDLVYLNLSNVSATLGVAEIEVGNYSKLWINVTNATGVLNSTGEEVNITVPSGWLKIQQLHLFNITKGNHTITVDIDLEGSIHTFHGGEEYKFIPVISYLEHKHEKQLRFREHDKSKIKNMVGNRKPAIDIYINGTIVKNNINLEGNETYEFNASATLDLDGDPLTFEWDFGDETNATGAVVEHKYPEGQGTYQVWLTVSDGEAEATEHFVVKISMASGGGNGNDGNGNGGNGQG
jgi:hypothetical protein